MSYTTAISLGWNCNPSIYAVRFKLRLSREQGYKTCPFDLMISNYVGMLECLRTDFKDFCNPIYLTIKHGIIYNTKYNFGFNHESPHHANLATIQKWSGGEYHFINNNYEKFIERYQRRIANFRNYINDPNATISFIISRFNHNPIELEDLLVLKYPNLKFKIICLRFGSEELKRLEHDNVRFLMNYPDESCEMQRFSQAPCGILHGRFEYIYV